MIKKQQAKQLEGMKKQREKALSMWNLRSCIGCIESKRMCILVPDEDDVDRKHTNLVTLRDIRRKKNNVLTAFGPAS